MADEHTRIVVPGKPLGRLAKTDPRSARYSVVAQGSVASVEWKRVAPIFDQGNLGSCTGNATAGVLGTEPFAGTVPGLVVNEALAVKLYSAATQLDDEPENYPPTDTGSDSNSVAKAARNLNLFSGWQHITSLAAAQTAIQSGPIITGVNWYEGFDNPDDDGVVTISGQVRGGHEFELVGYDADKKLWKAANSWGTVFGVDGYFFFSDTDFAQLLDEEGDAVSFVPITAPAPTPSPEPTPDPEPTPTPTPTPAPTSDFPVDVVKKWLYKKHYTGREERAVDAIEKWMKDQGLL